MFRLCIACSTGAAHSKSLVQPCTANGSHHCDCPIADCEHQRALNRNHVPILKAMGVATGLKMGGATTLFTIAVELSKALSLGFEIAPIAVVAYLAFTYRALRI